VSPGSCPTGNAHPDGCNDICSARSIAKKTGKKFYVIVAEALAQYKKNLT
jgi:hypothetical protein